MTKKTDKPEESAPENEGAGLADVLGMIAMRGGNSKPDTAEGVAELVREVHDLLGEKHMVDFGNLIASDGTQVPVIRTPHGSLDYIPLEKLDAYAPRPTYRRGTARLTSLVSFIAHVNRFGDADSAVFANDSRTSPSLTAVLDYHRKDEDGEHGEYRHGLHRTRYEFPLSDEWKAWNEASGSVMSMVEFAMFLEKHMGDIAFIEDDVPESAQRFVEQNGGEERIADWQKLDAMARGMRIDEDAKVEEAVNLSSGEGKIMLQSDHSAMVNGLPIVVPRMFFIAIPVFRNGDFYRLPCSLRYRTKGGLKFWFDIHRADRAFDQAFREDVGKVEDQTDAQVLFGSPE